VNFSIYLKKFNSISVVNSIASISNEYLRRNQKAFMAYLKYVYKAATLNAFELELDELESEWGDKSPTRIGI
jgi:putative transposase